MFLNRHLGRPELHLERNWGDVVFLGGLLLLSLRKCKAGTMPSTLLQCLQGGGSPGEVPFAHG